MSLTVTSSTPSTERVLLPLLSTVTSIVFSPPSAGKLKEVGLTDTINGISALSPCVSLRFRGTSCPVLLFTAARPEIETPLSLTALNVLSTKAVASFLQNTTKSVPELLKL